MMLAGLQTVYSAMQYANLTKAFFTLKILCDFSNITNIHKHFFHINNIQNKHYGS